MITYRDAGHMTNEYSASLAVQLAQLAPLARSTSG
jgi:hypothetical protein